MKRLVLVLASLALVFTFSIQVMAADGCTTIKDGTLTASDGFTILETGFDEFGYNYQAHMFNGRYCDYDRVPGGSYCEVDLVMKWNDIWLSNQDCNGDGNLDRGYTCDPTNANNSGCAGAWCTNHQKGTYVDSNGKKQRWEYLVKIVAPAADAYVDNGIWYTAGGEEIGPVIWGAFAIIQQVYNDTGTGEHGIEYLSPFNAGLGFMNPKP